MPETWYTILDRTRASFYNTYTNTSLNNNVIKYSSYCSIGQHEQKCGRWEFGRIRTEMCTKE